MGSITKQFNEKDESKRSILSIIDSIKLEMNTWLRQKGLEDKVINRVGYLIFKIAKMRIKISRLENRIIDLENNMNRILKGKY